MSLDHKFKNQDCKTVLLISFLHVRFISSFMPWCVKIADSWDQKDEAARDRRSVSMSSIGF